VKACFWIPERRYLITGGWDGFVSVWDLRTPPAPAAQACVVPVWLWRKPCAWLLCWRTVALNVDPWPSRLNPVCVRLQVQMGERVYAMDCRFPVMVCGMAEAKNPATQRNERKLSIFDLNNPTRPIRVSTRPGPVLLPWG
jgi:hypothetical protein